MIFKLFDIWDWVTRTVFPFISLKKYFQMQDAFDGLYDKLEDQERLISELRATVTGQFDLIDFQATRIAELLDQVDALTNQVEDSSHVKSEYDMIKAELPQTDRDDIDDAIERLETDGVIDPMIWGHPGKD